jgi:hypothetical protein
LSAWSLAGRFRGRPDLPRGPMIEGITSTSGNSCVESWVLVAERWIASGTPFRSTTRWYLEPGLPRSTGLGPVCSPPFRPHAHAVHARPRPGDAGFVAEPVQERLMQALPDACFLPIAQAAPTG